MIHTTDAVTGTPGNATIARISEGKARAARIACDVVGQTYRIPPGELTAPTRRTPRTARARQVAMYLTHVTFGVTLADVGRAFGRDRTTVAHACRRVEQRRDDPVLDAALTRLEARMRTRFAEGGAA